jgi:hypothetical protein
MGQPSSRGRRSRRLQPTGARDGVDPPAHHRRLEDHRLAQAVTPEYLAHLDRRVSWLCIADERSGAVLQEWICNRMVAAVWRCTPGLKHSGRAYSRKWERRHWRLDLVLEHLADYAVPRQVDTSGSVSIYNKTYYVGGGYTGTTVYVSVKPLRREGLFRDTQGNHVRTQPAEQLCQERIVH